jgi:hypothetical protein
LATRKVCQNDEILERRGLRFSARAIHFAALSGTVSKASGASIKHADFAGQFADRSL